MIEMSCLCGRVQIALDERPDHINECNCALCAKSGARWAYFHPSKVRVMGETSGYVRADKADPAADLRFCPRCGSTTHFRLTPGVVARHGDVMMGVNMWLADPDQLAGIELRYPDGRAWSGDGPFGHVRPARSLGT